ncbi:MAG: methionyl-tRNA formyltransferase [Rhodospirillales bacterium]|nr:methionyl-tRNA formyltransferase [Rhodospirillales bacterium]
MRIVFMGTPNFSLAALEALVADGHDVACVYTRAPKPKGRGQKLTFSPIHDYAQNHAIEIRHPRSLKNPQAQKDFVDLNADVGIVAAYGLILPRAILDAPKYGCLNIHASLLPRWRGASPIQRAIAAGDLQTGITIMQMDEGLDTGPMIARRALPIRDKTTAESLHDALAALGAAMIVETLRRLEQDGRLEAEPQDETLSTYAPLLRKEEGRIDWSAQAMQIDRIIRAFTPWPGAWTVTTAGKTLKILEAQPEEETYDAPPGTLIDRAGRVACGEGGILRLIRVQPESARAMDASAAINGGYAAVGETFGMAR